MLTADTAIRMGPMQLLSFMTAPATPAAAAVTPVRAMPLAGMPVAGFGLLVEGLVPPAPSSVTKPGVAGTAPVAPGDGVDDSALAGMMQTMGLVQPAIPQAPPTVVGLDVLPPGGGEVVPGQMAAMPAFLPAPVPQGSSSLPGPLPAVSGHVPGAAVTEAVAPPSPALVPAVTGTPVTGTTGIQAQAGSTTPAAESLQPAALPVPAAPVTDTGAVPAALQAVVYVQAGATTPSIALPTTTPPADDRSPPSVDGAAPRVPSRPRTGAAAAPSAAAPAAGGTDPRPGAVRLPVADEAAGGEEVVPDPVSSPAAGPSEPSSLPVATGPSLPTLGRDASVHALASSRPVSTPVSPGQQLVARIEQAVAEDRKTLTVQLDPEHLGRVEVKLEMQDGRLTAMIAAERPATLDLLQRDVRLIERTLLQGGMQMHPDGLQFSLREGGGQWAQAEQDRRGVRFYGQQMTGEPALDPLTPASSRSDSIVDIQI